MKRKPRNIYVVHLAFQTYIIGSVHFNKKSAESELKQKKKTGLEWIISKRNLYKADELIYYGE